MKKFKQYLEMAQNSGKEEIKWNKEEIEINQLAGPLQYEVEKLSLDEEKITILQSNFGDQICKFVQNKYEASEIYCYNSQKKKFISYLSDELEDIIEEFQNRFIDLETEKKKEIISLFRKNLKELVPNFYTE